MKQILDNTAPLVEYIETIDVEKTVHEIEEKEPKLYTVPKTMGKFRGYNSEDALLIINPSRSVLRHKERLLKQLMDRYPFQVEIPWGFHWCKPRRVYIVSSMSMSEFAACLRQPDSFTWRMREFGVISDK